MNRQCGKPKWNDCRSCPLHSGWDECPDNPVRRSYEVEIAGDSISVRGRNAMDALRVACARKGLVAESYSKTVDAETGGCVYAQGTALGEDTVCVIRASLKGSK